MALTSDAFWQKICSSARVFFFHLSATQKNSHPLSNPPDSSASLLLIIATDMKQKI